MKKYNPIAIHPLTMRGVFGITWKIYSRGFGPAALYSLIYMLITAFVASPWMMIITRISASPVNAFSINGAAGLVGAFISAMLFSMLGGLAVYLVVVPAFMGTMYSEMSARLYGAYSSFSEMMKRFGHMLKRFFVTNLCYLVIVYAISMVLSVIIVAAAVGSMVPALIGNNGEFTSQNIWPLVIVAVLTMLLSVAGELFVTLTYPVAVNEPVKNFNAVFRSMKLVFKRFGRILLATLIVALVMMLIAGGMFTCVGLAMDGVLNIPEVWEWVIGIAGYAIIALVFMPYIIALHTVLYYDARVRVDGEGWLGSAGGAQTGDAPSGAAQGSYETASAPVNDAQTGAYEAPAYQPSGAAQPGTDNADYSAPRYGADQNAAPQYAANGAGSDGQAANAVQSDNAQPADPAAPNGDTRDDGGTPGAGQA